MKLLLSIPLLMLFLTTNTKAQELERNANHIKNNYPNEYRDTIRRHAIEEWGNDHRMIVYYINQQADALFELVNSFESENSRILYDAMIEWSHDGFESQNREIWNELDTANVEQLIPMHCDWRMVKYMYDRQTEAKNAY